MEIKTESKAKPKHRAIGIHAMKTKNFTCEKTLKQLQGAYGKIMVEDLDDAVRLNCRAVTASANVLAASSLGKDEAQHFFEVLRMQLHLQTLRSAKDKLNELGVWMEKVPGLPSVSADATAMEVALEKAEATVARLSAMMNVEGV